MARSRRSVAASTGRRWCSRSIPRRRRARHARECELHARRRTMRAAVGSGDCGWRCERIGAAAAGVCTVPWTARCRPCRWLRARVRVGVRVLWHERVSVMKCAACDRIGERSCHGQPLSVCLSVCRCDPPQRRADPPPCPLHRSQWQAGTDREQLTKAAMRPNDANTHSPADRARPLGWSAGLRNRARKPRTHWLEIGLEGEAWKSRLMYEDPNRSEQVARRADDALPARAGGGSTKSKSTRKREPGDQTASEGGGRPGV